MTTDLSNVKHCSRCGVNPRRSVDQRYCFKCHRDYQREWKRQRVAMARDLRALVEKHTGRNAA